MPAFFSRNGSLTGGDLEANDIKSATGGVLVVDTSDNKSTSSSESCSSNSESGDNRFGCFTSFSLYHSFPPFNRGTDWQFELYGINDAAYFHTEIC